MAQKGYRGLPLPYPPVARYTLYRGMGGALAARMGGGSMKMWMWRGLRGALLLGVLTLGAPVSGRARVGSADAPRVLRVTPTAGMSEAPRATPVLVFFDRPIVPLAALSAGEAVASAAPARIDPSVAGRGRWLNTATWAFYPAPALRGATRYTVTVPAGLRAVDGSTLADPYTARFMTVRPAVARVTPAGGTVYADYRAPVTVRFNQDVDRASVATAFALRDGAGRPVPGMMSWPRGDTLVFHPSAGLRPGVRYNAAVSRALRSAEGPLAARGDAAWGFATAGAPTLVDSAPANGTRAADTSQGVSLRLSAPVLPALVRARLLLLPRPKDLNVGVSEDGLTVYLYGSFAPSTHYHLALGGTIGAYGQTLARPIRLGFITAPLQPAVQFSYSNGLVSFDAYRPVDVAVRAVNTRGVTLTLSPLARDEFLGLAQGSNLQQFRPRAAPILSVDRSTAAPLNRTTMVGQELSSGGRDGLLRPGFYFLRAEGSGGGSDGMAFMVTRTALTLKAGAGRALVWATDLRSGRPLPGLTARLVRTDSDGLVMAGRTGSDGALDAPYRYAPPQYTYNLAVLLDRPGDAALCGVGWGNGVQPYNYNLPAAGSPLPRAGYLYTDRPIYRPGQSVRYRGVARRDDDGAYGLPVAGTPVRVTLSVPEGRVLYSALTRLDAYGSFSGVAPLSAGTALGGDTLTAQVGAQTFTVSLQVAAYRKPDYTVAVGSTRSDGNYTSGSTVRVAVAARYLFGAPMDRARVHWSVVASDLYFSAPAYPDYTFQDYPYIPFGLGDYGGPARPLGARPQGYPAPAGGPPGEAGLAASYAGFCEGQCGAPGQNVAARGDARTDAGGNLTLSIPALLRHAPLGQQWSVEARVSDVNNTSVSGRADVLVHAGQFYVGLKGPSSLVVAGQPARVDLLTLGQDGATRIPRIPLALRLYRRAYRAVGDPNAYGGQGWRPVDTLVKTFASATDAHGRGHLVVTIPSSGEYRLVADARDAGGRLVRSALALYAAGADEAASPWANPPQDRVRLVPDRALYRVGDVARLLVAAPRPGLTALVTIERGHVYSHQVLRLAGASPILRVPIAANYVPDMFVSVVLVGGTGSGSDAPLWKMGEAELPVDVRARRLRVTVDPGVARARPGQRLTVRLRAADPNGRPVRGQFSLGVVDAGVLSLAADASPAILDAFYAERGLAVQTAYSQNIAAFQLPAGDHALSASKRAQRYAARSNALAPAGGRGGGGGVGGPGVPGGKPRAYFPDTAYWNSTVTTDASGVATIPVTLPDSLTTWRIAARGLTADTLVGQASADVVSTRDLLLRPVLPRFLTLGDGARVGAVVNNTTGRTVTARVTLTPSGVPSTAGALESMSVVVPAGGERLVTWPLRPAALGALRVALTATAAGLDGDSVIVSAPVVPNSTPETVATSGEAPGTAGPRVEEVRVPAGAQPGEGGLTLTLQPSLAAGLRSGVDYLQRYPYASNEDLATRVMGEAALARLPVTAVGVDVKTLDAYRRDIASTIGLLVANQRGDGGWGWWVDDPYSSPEISAFCLDALGAARRASYPVPGAALAPGLRYLGRQQRSSATPALAVPGAPGDAVTPDLRAYMAYVLAASGNDAGAGTALYPARDTLPVWSRAYLLRTLYVEGRRRVGPKGRTVLTELDAAAHVDAAGAHWEGVGNDAAMDDSIHATAAVLDALVETDPLNPLIAPATRWLVSARGGEAWPTTVENALAVRALSDELRGSGELAGRYAYSATIGGGTWGTGRVDAGTLARPRVLTTPIGPALGPGSATRVAVRRSNTSGRLYYTLRLAYYPRVDTVKPLARGVAIAREYLYNGHPVTSAPAGAVLRVRLTVTAAQDLYYVGVEDPFPAGAEAVDPTLLTTSQLQAGGYRVPRGASDLAWYVTHAELRDDRAALFADYLPAGIYRYEYAVQLTTRGVFHALPSHVAETYFPEVFGRGSGGYLTVR